MRQHLLFSLGREPKKLIQHMQYVHSSLILLMSQGALTAPSLEEPKVTRWVNKVCSWVQDKARLGGESMGHRAPHNCKPKCRIFVTSLEDIRDSEMETKSMVCKKFSSKCYQGELLCTPGKHFLFWRQTEQKTVSGPRLTPCLVHATDYQSCLRLLPHKHIKIFSSQNKHDTISVNENLK